MVKVSSKGEQRPQFGLKNDQAGQLDFSLVGNIYPFFYDFK